MDTPSGRVQLIPIAEYYADTEAGKLLTEGMADKEVSVRLAVVEGLRGVRAPKALTLAEAAVKDADPAVRREAAIVMGWDGSDKYPGIRRPDA